jgi:hypothetical protein
MKKLRTSRLKSGNDCYHQMQYFLSSSLLSKNINTNTYRVSQEESAKLRESVPYVKVYRYNPKHLYPNLNSYGDNSQRKVGASCGSTYCTCSADRVTRTLRMPILESFIAANVRLRYERFVTCMESAVQSEREVVHMYARTHVPCKVLGTLRTTALM